MRVAVRIVAVGLVLGLVTLAFVLVPPHLQIRSVEPPLPTADELRALAAVADGPVRVRRLTTSSQRLPRGRLGHDVFVVEWGDGRLFLIDAGMDRATADEFADLMRQIGGAGEHVVHGDVAELLGPAVSRVQGVGFTHLHIDHAQGIVPLCGALAAAREAAPRPALVQTPDQRGLHNLHTQESAALVKASCLDPAPLGGERLLAAEGFPGLGIAALGGHTPGSTLFALHAEGRLWLFSGDITNSKAELLENVGKGFVYSVLMVPEHTGRTEALRRWLAELDAQDDVTVVVSHDPDASRADGLPEWTPEAASLASTSLR